MSFARLAALLGFAGVALGAFGAHALRTRIDAAALEIYRTGVLYHMLHAVALLAVALGAQHVRAPRVVCGLFAAGIVIFSGSLYVLAISGVRWWGAVTPFGGAAFMAGWVVLAVSVRRPST